MNTKGFNLASLTMGDMIHLHEAQRCLDAMDDAIRATSMQAKPAMLELCLRAYNEVRAVMRKGARRALILGQAGRFSRMEVPQELVGKLLELSPQTAAELPES